MEIGEKEKGGENGRPSSRMKAMSEDLPSFFYLPLSFVCVSDFWLQKFLDARVNSTIDRLIKKYLCQLYIDCVMNFTTRPTSILLSFILNDLVFNIWALVQNCTLETQNFSK